MRRRTGRYADEPSRSYGEETAYSPNAYAQSSYGQGGYEQPQQMAAGYGSYAPVQDFGQTSAYQGGASAFGSYGGFGGGSSYAQ